MTQDEEDRWTEHTKNLLKSELKRRGLSYEDLADKLESIGVSLTTKALINKVSRGGFSASFFLMCMAALGVKTLSLEP